MLNWHLNQTSFDLLLLKIVNYGQIYLIISQNIRL